MRIAPITTRTPNTPSTITARTFGLIRFSIRWVQARAGLTARSIPHTSGVTEQGRSASVDEIVAKEREARDEEAAEYTGTRARDSYERAVEDAAIFDALQLTPADTVLDAG